MFDLNPVELSLRITQFEPKSGSIYKAILIKIRFVFDDFNVLARVVFYFAMNILTRVTFLNKPLNLSWFIMFLMYGEEIFEPHNTLVHCLHDSVSHNLGILYIRSPQTLPRWEPRYEPLRSIGVIV